MEPTREQVIKHFTEFTDSNVIVEIGNEAPQICRCNVNPEASNRILSEFEAVMIITTHHRKDFRLEIFEEDLKELRGDSRMEIVMHCNKLFGRTRVILSKYKIVNLK
jgi:hypothetical protein